MGSQVAAPSPPEELNHLIGVMIDFTSKIPVLSITPGMLEGRNRVSSSIVPRVTCASAQSLERTGSS